MDLTVEQLEELQAGRPVRIEISGAAFYILNEDLFQDVLRVLQFDPEQQAFRKFSLGQAARMTSG